MLTSGQSVPSVSIEMNVLLLEPDHHHGIAQQEALERAGHCVVRTTNMAHALAQFRNFEPDLLVMELMLDDQTALPLADYAAFARPSAEVVLIVRQGLFPNGELYQMATNLAWILRDPQDTSAMVDLADHAAFCQNRMQPNTVGHLQTGKYVAA